MKEKKSSLFHLYSTMTKIKNRCQFEMLKRTKLEEVILDFIQEEMKNDEDKGLDRNIADFNLEELRFYIQKRKKEYEKS